MEDTRKEYIPPEAEIILLAPSEKLANWATPYTSDDEWFVTPYASDASAITAGGTLGPEIGTGFVIRLE